MSFPIEFQKKASYPSLEIGITIEAILRYGNLQTECFAKVDTGAQFCLFERGIAESLDIDVKSGFREKFSTLSGAIYAFAHEIELETLNLRFQSYVYFAESYTVNRNLLGRQGWLQLVKLGLDDYHNHLYLSPTQD